MEIAPVKPTIEFEDFDKVDIRVGTIKRVEDIEGSDKLVRLIVDLEITSARSSPVSSRSGKIRPILKAGRPCSWSTSRRVR